MNKLGWFLLVGFATGAGDSFADDAVSIYGFEFGRPIALPECEPDATLSRISGKKTYPVFSKFDCQKEAAQGGDPAPTVEINWGTNNWPLGVKWGRALATLVDGNLAGFHFSTTGANSQEFVMSELTKKFGQPTSVTRQPVQNLAGASFNAINAVWSGGPVTVTFYGIMSKLDQGEVYIDIPEVAKLRETNLRSRTGPKM